LHRPAVHGGRGGAVLVPRGLRPRPGRRRARVLLLRPAPPHGDGAGPAADGGHGPRDPRAVAGLQLLHPCPPPRPPHPPRPPRPPPRYPARRARGARAPRGAAVPGAAPGGRPPPLPVRGLRGGAPRRPRRALGTDRRAEGGGLPRLRRHRAAPAATAGRAGGGQAMTDGPAGFLIRPAQEGDLDVIAGFEIDIARVSFGAEAIEDPALHRKRVAAALGKPGEVTLVAVTEQDAGAPVGWAWLSGRTNSLTGARYGNFRSLATAEIPGRAAAAELLMAAVLRAAEQAGYTHL